MHELREEVISSDEPIPQLYSKKVNHTGLDFVLKIPPLNNATSFLYGARNKSLEVSKTVFKIPSEIEVPVKHRSSILAEYHYEDTHILVFCTEMCRKLFSKINEYFFDATFDSCPFPFVQLFNLHGDIGSTIETTNVVPLLFALMTNKKQSSYYILFKMIMSQLNEWKPVKIHCDFEKASMNAVKDLFPNLIVKGCFYHWTKNVWKKGRKLGFTNTKSEQRIVGLTAALPLIPSNNILEGWRYIKSECGTKLDMSKFIKYIERFWFTTHNPDIISVFGERHRTNNALESYHSKLSKCVNRNNNTLLRLLNKILNFQGKTSLHPKRKKKQIANDCAIMEIQMQLINGVITVGYALDKLR